MALWKEAYFSESEVIAWADAEILKGKSDPEDSLIELSLKGPGYCSKLPSYEFPASRELSFSERFAKMAWRLQGQFQGYEALHGT